MNLDLSGISLPFNVGDVVSGGVELIGLAGPYIVLSLAVIFAPKIIDLLRFVFLGERENKENGDIYGRNHSVIGYRDENGKRVVLKNLKRMSKYRD